MKNPKGNPVFAGFPFFIFLDFWADCRNCHSVELVHLRFNVVLRQVSVDHRRRDIPMPERCRHRGEIASFHHHQGCARMAQLMDRHTRNLGPVGVVHSVPNVPVDLPSLQFNIFPFQMGHLALAHTRKDQELNHRVEGGGRKYRPDVLTTFPGSIISAEIRYYLT